ncbi:hypothetical protein GE061_011097 [Apolygus lucorum]|uniref:DUF4794 domain-containing protein n=1 Tax=Apolygus lucorum TaxID=248454 RepID=A0A8S9XYN3_APOLU|nr:hypothetical protein GE061_011097 [Apolygus lucorum]
MTSYLCFSILLVASLASATTYRKSYRSSYDDSGEAYSSHGGSSTFKGSGRAGYAGSEGRSSQNKRDFNAGYDGDDFIPPVGIQHNNDYSGLGEGYQDYASGGSGGTGAISYSHVVTEHRPVQRVQPSRIRAEGTSVVEKPVPFPLKVQIPVLPAFDRQYLPLVPLGPVTPAVIAPVKYPIQFFKPFSYFAPEKHSSAPAKGDQPEYVLTKVPLVYHASYSEAPASQSGFNHGSVNINHALSNFNAPTFNHGGSAFNHGANSVNQNFNHGHNFNHGNNFNHGFNHINPTISTPGSPSFSNFNHVPPPTPLVPTPTPYHHHHSH